MRERAAGAATTYGWPFGLLGDTRVLLSALCLALNLGACGDEDWSHDTVSPRDSGVRDADGAAASGGKSGNTGSPRAGGGPGFPNGLPTPELQSVQCGTAVCVSPTAGFGFIKACCADEATSICGITGLSGTCMKPDPGDPRCPALNFRGLISLPSCCNEEHQCGLDATRVGMPGCMDLSWAAQQARVWGISDDEIPPPRPCGASESTHADAGAADAGS